MLDTNVLSEPVRQEPDAAVVGKLREHGGELATTSVVWHAEQSARLSKRGLTPAFADGQIAAVAAVHDLVLVTNNVQGIERYPDLRVERWHRAST